MNGRDRNMGHKRKKGSASELLPDRRDQVPKFEIFVFFLRFFHSLRQKSRESIIFFLGDFSAEPPDVDSEEDTVDIRVSCLSLQKIATTRNWPRQKAFYSGSIVLMMQLPLVGLGAIHWRRFGPIAASFLPL